MLAIYQKNCPFIRNTGHLPEKPAITKNTSHLPEKLAITRNTGNFPEILVMYHKNWP
jgi:hypothetical protein